jgi:hypothetical protein
MLNNINMNSENSSSFTEINIAQECLRCIICANNHKKEECPVACNCGCGRKEEYCPLKRIFCEEPPKKPEMK